MTLLCLVCLNVRNEDVEAITIYGGKALCREHLAKMRARLQALDAAAAEAEKAAIARARSRLIDAEEPTARHGE